MALLQVTIPLSVTCINEYASTFWRCISLKAIIIPSSVTLIEEGTLQIEHCLNKLQFILVQCK